MDPKERIEKASELCGNVVANIKADQLDNQTPCSEFKVRDLLNHVIGGLAMLEGAASGGAPAMPEGDQFGDDPGAEYAARRAKLLEAISAEGVFERTWKMPFGELPGAMMAGIAFMEHATHTWDLAKATGQPTELPSDLVAELDQAIKPMDQMLRMPGVCGPAIEAPADASNTDKLMAFLGREI